MTILFPIIQVVVLVACLPAYRVAKKRQHEPAWSLFLVAPCLLTWIILTMSGIGAQSLGNIVELFDLMLGTIALYYFRVFLMDRTNPSPVMNNLVVVILTVAAATLLRLYMPLIPK